MLIKVFLHEKACGDSLLLLRSLCMLRQQSVFGIPLLGFRQYLYAPLYFAFTFVPIGSIFHVLPTHNLMHGAFFSVFSFDGVLFYFVCTTCIVQSVTSHLEVHLPYTDK